MAESHFEDDEDISDLLSDDRGLNSAECQEYQDQEDTQQQIENDDSESEDDADYSCLNELPPRLIPKYMLVGKAAYDDALLFKHFTDLEIIEDLADQLLVRAEDKYLVVFNDDSFSDDYYRQMMMVKHPNLDESKADAYMTFNRFKRDIMAGFRYWAERGNQHLGSTFLGGFTFEEVKEWLKKVLEPKRPAVFYKESFKTLGRSVNFVKRDNKPLPPKECVELAKVAQADDGYITTKEAELVKPTPPVYASFEQLSEEEFFNVVQSHLQAEEVHSKFKGSLRFPLVLTLLKLLTGFPFGAVPIFLNEEFRRQKGYSVDYENLGFETFEELFTEHDHIFRVVKKGHLFLVFPYWRTDRIDIDAVKMQLLHWLAILARSKKDDNEEIRLADVTEKLEGYRFPFKPQAWGVNNHELYYRTFLVEYDSNQSYARSVRKECHDDPSRIKYYYVLEQPEKLKKIEPADPPQHIFIPPRRTQVINPVPQPQPKDDLPEDELWLKENVHPLKQPLPSRKFKTRFTDVLPDELASPALFFVSPSSEIEEKENFIDRMTIAYNNLKKNSPVKFSFLSIPPKLLNPGSIVAKHFPGTGWLRLQIKSLGKSHCKAILVDYGESVQQTPLDELKYLLKACAADSPYSLCCTLRKKYLDMFTSTKKFSFPNLEFGPYVVETFIDLVVGGEFRLELSEEIKPNLYEVHLYVYSVQEDQWANLLDLFFDALRRSRIRNGEPGIERMYQVDLERKKKRQKRIQEKDGRKVAGYSEEEVHTENKPVFPLI